MGEPTLEVLVKRVERLERQNRRFRLGGLGVLLAAGSFLLVGAAGPAKTVQAENFVLLDDTGKQLAVLHNVPKQGPTLEMHDSIDGKRRLALYVDGDGPGLTMYDHEGKQRATLEVEDGPFLALEDDADKIRLMLGVQPEERGQKPGPFLAMGLLQGVVMRGALLRPEGDELCLGVYDSGGKLQSSLGIEQGKPGISLRNAQGKVLFRTP